ncbi:unnamed protein product [Nippostrongylus brasiliensis]|uniref:Glucose transporter type 1 (inferred by orthology to a D. melanogaster protein) n=1 Tax=Nippostrongylus brasiliensis TaxID=27835 RepID=A0A0N4XZK8_NIPBR|nr:unnamed protein product [Nippostrongylus brasiliensis]
MGSLKGSQCSRILRYGWPLNLTESNIIWSFVVSSLAVGAIVGAACTGVIAEKVGRRNGLIANGAVNVLGAVCELMSKRFKLPELLILGRFIFGINMGLTSGLVPMYLMEITPVKHRGQAGTLHQVAVAFSDWFSLLIGLPELLGNDELWPLAFALPGLPALALCIVLPFCPESPKYTLTTLLKKEKAMEDISTLVTEPYVKPVFDALIKETASDRSKVGSLRRLLTAPELRVPLVVSVLVMIAQQFTGCTAVFAYSTEMFLNAELSPMHCQFEPDLLLIKRVGRRPLSLFQLTGCLLALVLLSFLTYFQHKWNITWASYGTIFALVMYMCVYGVGSPIPWMITSELFTQQYRSTAVTLSVFVAWSLAFVISTTYLPFQQLVGVPLSYVPFIIVISISIVVMYYLLPETRDHSIQEIVSEVRRRTRTISTGRPWQANAPTSQDELQRLLDNIEQQVYDSRDNLFD